MPEYNRYRQLYSETPEDMMLYGRPNVQDISGDRDPLTDLYLRQGRVIEGPNGLEPADPYDGEVVTHLRRMFSGTARTMGSVM